MPTCTPGSSTTTHYGFCKPADGETNWGTAYRTTMDAIDDAIFDVGIPRSYLAGLQTTPTQSSTSVSIAVGVCMGNDQATAIRRTSALVKVLSSSWAVGTGNGGLYAATSIQANQSYHVLVILRTDTDVVDAYFDTSATGVNIPSPYTIYRRIASFKTDVNKNIQSYTQDGDYFTLETPVLDYNATNPGTNAVTVTLASVPTGVNFRAMTNVLMYGGTTTEVAAYVSDLAASDQAASLTASPLSSTGSSPSASTGGPGGYMEVRTNTSAQIRSRLRASGAADVMRIATLGWIDSRGRND